MEEVFITAKRQAALEATVLSVLRDIMDFIADIPAGVAAFPIPSMFAVMFMLIWEKAMWFLGISGNNK